MNLKQSLLILGATSAAMLWLSSASAAQLVDMSKVTSASNNLVATNDLVQLKTVTDKRGNVHTRYVQQYNGVPVYGYQIIKHQRVKGIASAKAPEYTGTYVNDLQADVANVKAAFSSAEALTKAKQLYTSAHANLAAQQLNYTNENSKLVYFINAKQQAQLAYAVNFFVDITNGGAPARPYYILDAKTGAVLQQWNGLTTDQVGTGPGGNTKTGQHNYDGTTYGMLDVKVNADSSVCSMLTANVKTVNLDGGYSGKKAYHFPCFVSDTDAINGAFSPLNDAHYYGGVIFGMYNDWYNTAPLNTALTMRVHYGVDYENAFWDGQAMSFGDGYTMFYPLVSLDVAGHEVSHGFTEQNSGLNYWSQSGGMNEAFSDIAGKAAEFYMLGSNSNWSVGEDIFKADGALRYMDDPTLDGMSIDNVDDYYEGLDVHYSSGVFNHAFYLLANSDGYTTKTAFDLMVYANQNYWQSNSTFQDGANGVLLAANDLGYDTTAVIAAFANVGITLE